MSETAKLLIVLLNGPLGVGKSTLGEALAEAVEGSVALDGDSLLAVNPEPIDPVSDLHSIVELIVGHRAAQGYRCFIINHYWARPEQIRDLELRLMKLGYHFAMRCFRLTLSEQENRRRIRVRRASRAVDETEHEDHHFSQEFAHLSLAEGSSLGVKFDASDPPELLVERMLAVLGLPLH